MSDTFGIKHFMTRLQNPLQTWGRTVAPMDTSAGCLHKTIELKERCSSSLSGWWQWPGVERGHVQGPRTRNLSLTYSRRLLLVPRQWELDSEM